MSKEKRLQVGSEAWHRAVSEAPIGSDLWIEGKIGHYVGGPVARSSFSGEPLLKEDQVKEKRRVKK